MTMYIEPGEPFIMDVVNGYSWYFLGKSTKYALKKYNCTYEMRDRGEDDQDYIHLRYADVLLMYAEAKNELNQFGETEWNQTQR